MVVLAVRVHPAHVGRCIPRAPSPVALRPDLADVPALVLAPASVVDLAVAPALVVLALAAVA
jgi:hypothetical protein